MHQEETSETNPQEKFGSSMRCTARSLDPNDLGQQTNHLCEESFADWDYMAQIAADREKLDNLSNLQKEELTRWRAWNEDSFNTTWSFEGRVREALNDANKYTLQKSNACG